jgi:hypothetical protein
MAFYYGSYPYWGLYNPNFTYPILQSDYKISGLLNEYDELNDLAIQNNMIYAQSLAENCRDCNNRDLSSSTSDSPRNHPYHFYHPHYYNYLFRPHYYPYYYPYRPGYYPYYL